MSSALLSWAEAASAPVPSLRGEMWGRAAQGFHKWQYADITIFEIKMIKELVAVPLMFYSLSVPLDPCGRRKNKSDIHNMGIFLCP